MKKSYLLFSVLILSALASCVAFSLPTKAQDADVLSNEEFHINLDKETIAKGYRVNRCGYVSPERKTRYTLAVK